MKKKKVSDDGKIVRAVSALVSKHADRRGMTKSLLDSICRTLCPNLYKGLYNASDIPIATLQNFKSFTIILFLTSKDLGVSASTNVGHFVTVHATPSTILYIDPYGLPPCFHPHVAKFLHAKKKRVVLVNRKQVQHVNSTHCGLFAVLYAVYFDDPSREKRFALRFPRKATPNNDKLCKRYLNEMLKKGTTTTK